MSYYGQGRTDRERREERAEAFRLLDKLKECEVRIRVGDRVVGGRGGERDTGLVQAIDGTSAVVGWDSGVTTAIERRLLRHTTERWSGGRRMDDDGR